MVDVISKRCQYEGCDTQPTFGFQGKRPLFCSSHRKEGMVDVKSKRCQYEGCDTRPTFGFQGKCHCFAQVIDKMVW